jgi:hypothetical protein
MEKNWLLGVVIVVCLLGSVVLALDPMGPPTAGLKQGQFSAGLDYAYSEMDLEFDGRYSWNVDYGSYTDTIKFDYELENSQIHKAYVNLGYGICDNWEVFLRLGGANLYDERSETETSDSWLDETKFDSDIGFSIGFGTKATVWEPSPELKVGVLAQASWASVDYSVKYEGVDDSYGNDWFVPTSGEMDFWEMQFALGATYKLFDNLSVYGGPFYYIFDGEYDYEGTAGRYDPEGLDYRMFLRGSYDVENDGCFGGYLGAHIDATDNVAVNAECQGASGALGFGLNLTWKF